MAAVLTRDILKGPPPPGSGNGWGGDGPEGRGSSRRTSFAGLLVMLLASGMLFAALSSAFLLRRSAAEDWTATPKPPILYVNTAVLFASSGALELARRALRRGARDSFNRYWTAGTEMGVFFLFGQALAWRQLSDLGFYVASTPSTSFFYVFTAAHAIHLFGGLAALIYVEIQALRFELGPAKRTIAGLSAVFWHFLDGLWLYLMILFTFWG